MITPFDEVTDFRNSTEENLEFMTTDTPVFTQKQLLLLKSECYIANMCTYADALDIVDLLERHPTCRFAKFPKHINKLARITYTRKEINKIARDLHRAMRKKLNLEQDYDPNTGEFLEQPEHALPDYEITVTVHLNIIGDRLFDLPC